MNHFIFARNIVRVGLAITFLWVGILIVKNPAAWAMVESWVINLLPLSIEQVMIVVGIFDILVGFLLLVDVLVVPVSLIAGLHLVSVLVVVGINAITVRDLGLAAMAFSLAFSYWAERKKVVSMFDERAEINHG